MAHSHCQPPSFRHRNRNWGQAQFETFLSFEVDLWGRLRSGNGGGASQPSERRRESQGQSSLRLGRKCGRPNTSRFREFDAELEIARQAFATRQESLKLTLSRSNYGIATELDVKQAEQLVGTADVNDFETCSSRLSNPRIRISLLLGRESFWNRAQGRFFDENTLPPEIPSPVCHRLCLRGALMFRAAEAKTSSRQSAGYRCRQGGIFPHTQLKWASRWTKHSIVEAFSADQTAPGVFIPQLSQPIFTAGPTSGQACCLAEAQRTIAGGAIPESDPKSAFHRSVPTHSFAQPAGSRSQG